MKKNRLITVVVWLVVVLSGPITILRSTGISDLLQSPEYFVYTFQRTAGLIAYSLLFIQIVIGSNMNFWLQLIGARAFKLHVGQGILAYAFVLLHPLLNGSFILLATQNLYEAFISFFPSADSFREYYINLGRLSIVLLTLGVGASRMRTFKIFRRRWQYFHYLNYAAFFLVFVHARAIGSDVNAFPFSVVFYAGFLIVAAILVHKILKLLAVKYNLGIKWFGIK